MRWHRAGVKLRVAQIARHALAGLDIDVMTTWQGDELGGSTLSLGPAEGAAESETIGAQPLAVDRFTIPCEARVFGFAPDAGAEAEAAAETVLDALDTALRATRRLTGLDGCDDGDTATYSGVVSVVVGEVEGPGHTIPAPGQTIQGWVTFDLVCTVDL